jgi:hypothetical protein
LTLLLTDFDEAELRKLLLSTDLFGVAVTCSRQIYSATPFVVGKCLIDHPEPDGRSVEALILPPDDPSNGRQLSGIIEIRTPADTETTEWLKRCLAAPRE